MADDLYVENGRKWKWGRVGFYAGYGYASSSFPEKKINMEIRKWVHKRIYIFFTCGARPHANKKNFSNSNTGWKKSDKKKRTDQKNMEN